MGRSPWYRYKKCRMSAPFPTQCAGAEITTHSVTPAQLKTSAITSGSLFDYLMERSHRTPQVSILGVLFSRETGSSSLARSSSASTHLPPTLSDTRREGLSFFAKIPSAFKHLT